MVLTTLSEKEIHSKSPKSNVTMIAKDGITDKNKQRFSYLMFEDIYLKRKTKDQTDLSIRNVQISLKI